MALVEFLMETLDGLKGTDIVHFDVRGKSSITDNMIICTGTSSRQVSAMADNLITECKKVKKQVLKLLVKKVKILQIGLWWILVKQSYISCNVTRVKCIN